MSFLPSTKLATKPDRIAKSDLFAFRVPGCAPHTSPGGHAEVKRPTPTTPPSTSTRGPSSLDTANDIEETDVARPAFRVPRPALRYWTPAISSVRHPPQPTPPPSSDGWVEFREIL